VDALLIRKLVVALAVYTSGIDTWAIVIPLICFKMVELHFLDRVMRQFNYRRHIPIYINTSDALHTITRRGKNDDYD